MNNLQDSERLKLEDIIYKRLHDLAYKSIKAMKDHVHTLIVEQYILIDQEYNYQSMTKQPRMLFSREF